MKLGDFKNRYVGHRAFFIGNGPSIKDTPLELLKDEYCFGTNRVIQLYERTDWRPTHYIAVTGENCKRKDWHDDMLKAIDTGIPCFLADWYFRKVSTPWYYPPKKDNVIYISAKRFSQEDGHRVVGWSTDIEDHVVQTRTVSVSFLQLAYWMGFNPLYLVGCDLGYTPFERGVKDPNHWLKDYDKERDLEDCIRENANMLYAHTGMAQLAKIVGAEVYNATIGGELEAYPRVDIYEVLNG